MSRRRHGRLLARGLALAAAGALLFLLGVALGQTLAERPRPGTRTSVRTLEPLPLPPPTVTETVTVPAP